MKRRCSDIGKTRAKIDKRIEALQNKMEALKKACRHPRAAILEGRYASGSFAFPPFRVCTECGYAEEGWGCGYWKLGKSNVPEVSRDEAMRHVQGDVLTQGEMSKNRYGHDETD